MGQKVFRPRTAVREEKRQANEALGRSFCKTIAEPVTNSDSSAKRKHKLPHASGLVDLMMKVQKGAQLDTSALRDQLRGKHPMRVITVEIVTARQNGRSPGEVVVIDHAQGMSPAQLKQALDEIGGNKLHLSAGVAGRNLFGRGLSDVMKAHESPVVWTYDGATLSRAEGRWAPGWKITLTDGLGFDGSPLDPFSPGTAVRFLISTEKRRQGCRIPDHPQILSRLANFYMLRLIASDPNVELRIRQFRAQGTIDDRIQFDFPVGQVIESCSRTFTPKDFGVKGEPLNVDFLVARSDGARPLPSGFPDRDARERGLLIVDDLDAVYDLTFADDDYEKAEFLDRLYGVVRVNGLRNVLESYLDAEHPTSPLRPDRDGFNRDHEFAKALLDFVAEHLRPLYEKERKRVEDKEKDQLSGETKRRIEDALKQLNKYFHRITELAGEGKGSDDEEIPEPTVPVLFFPTHTKLVIGRPKQVLLLVHEEAVGVHADIVATSSDGLVVKPESEQIDAEGCARWSAHKQFYAVPFVVSSSTVGIQGTVTAMVEGKQQTVLDAVLNVDDVLEEPVVQTPETLEFRPGTSTGRPNRRNNLVLYVNATVITPGHYVRVRITKRTGDVVLHAPDGSRTEELDIKLDAASHLVKGQGTMRVLIPWSGTAWNQHASVVASVKVGGAKPLCAEAQVRLDEPEDGGFFKRVEYGEIDPKAPSQFAAGVITVNINDPLNRMIFGETKDEFDKRLPVRVESQQRLASLLLEEASFRALQQRYLDNKVHFPDRREITTVHEEIDKYKFESASDVYRALARVRG